MKLGAVAQKLALFVIASLLSCGTAEVITRVFLPEPPRAIVARVRAPGAPSGPASAAPAPTHPVLTLYQWTPTGRRFRPNAHVVIEEHPMNGFRVEIRTNSLGHRHPEVGPKSRRRVLFLGDSITAQDFLPEDKTFVRLVEEIAQDRGFEIEAINAGVGAISLQTELAILVESGLQLEPDIVVLGFYLNDFADSSSVRYPKLPALLSWSWLARHIVVVASRRETPLDAGAWRSELGRLYPSGAGDYRVDKGAFNRLIHRHVKDWGGAWSPHAWERMTPLFAEFERLARSNDFKLMIVAFPVRQQVEASYVYDYPQQRLHELSRSLDVPLLDLLPILGSQSEYPAEEVFYDQCHHTPEGSRLIAGAIVDFLASAL